MAERLVYYNGLLADLIQWLEKHSRPCFYKKNFGTECPGCGFQRAFIELLKGNLLESLKQYPALIPLMVLMVFLALHIKFRFKHGALVLKALFILSAMLIVGNYLFYLILK